MKNFFFCICSLLIAAPLRAQDPVFNWSTADSKQSMQLNVKILGYSKDGFYVLNYKKASGSEFVPTLTLDHFNNEQERQFSKDITPPAQHDFIDVLSIGGKLYLLSSLFSKDEGSNKLLATLVQDGKMGKAIELASMNAEKLAGRGSYQVAASADGSKLLVIAEPHQKKDEAEKLTICIFDSQFQKQTASEQTLPYNRARYIENTPVINNNGVAYLLKKTDIKGISHPYTVLTFDGTSLKEFKIELDGKKKPASIKYAVSPSGVLAVAGYYTEDGMVRAGMGTALQGSFLTLVQHTGQSAISVITPFENKRKDIIVKDILFSNSTIIVLGERYYVSSRAAERDPSKPIMDMSTAFNQDYSYYGKDIIIDGFDQKGKWLYNNSISKDNASKNDNGTWVSYFAAVVNDQLYFLFNDDAYKHDDKKQLVVFNSPKIPVLVSVDAADGTVKKTTGLLNTGPVGGKKGDMLLRPDTFLKMDETHYILRAENKTDARIGMISFL